MSEYKSFEDFYKNELSFQLFNLETERKKTARAFTTAVLTGIGGILLFFIAQGNDSTIGVVAGVCCIVTGIGFIIIYTDRKKKFVSAFKREIVSRVIGYINPSFQYSPELCVSRDDYERSGLFLKKWDDYNGDDYVEGKLDKTYFCFSELHTQYRQQSGKSSHNVTIFRGLFFIGDFNKHFQGRTYVWSQSNPQLNFFTKIFSSFAANLEKVNLESSAFEQSFIVYSNDQVEARYILTPSFMERLMKLQQTMGSGISFSFINTNIHVAIPIRETLFEPSILSPNTFATVGDYYNTVHIVIDIINELKLNERLWTKE
jgi:hypothetical protein